MVDSGGEKTPLVDSKQHSSSTPFTVKSFRLGEGTSILGATVYIIGGMLSSGLFIAPAIIVRETQSGSVAAAVWVLAGLIAMGGAVSLCELGCQMPVSGGLVVYIKNIYGELAHVVAYSVLVGLVYPFVTAAIALTFGIYVQTTFGYGVCYGDLSATFLAAAMIGIVAYLNARGIRLAFVFQKIIMASQIMLILLIFTVGIYKFARNESPAMVQQSFAVPPVDFPYIQSGFIALYAALYAGDGWGGIFSFVGELKNPKRGVYIMSVVSVTMVTLSYVAVTCMILSCLSLTEMSASEASLSLFLQCAVSEWVSCLMPFFVCLSCLGGINSNFVTVGMYGISSAKMGIIPEVFGMVHTEHRSGIASIVLMTVLSFALLLQPSSSLQMIVNGMNFFVWILYTLCFLGVVILRYRYPSIVRQFKIWLPIPASLFLMGLMILVSLVFKRPIEFIAYVCLALLPLALYFLSRSRVVKSSFFLAFSAHLHNLLVKLFNLKEL